MSKAYFDVPAKYGRTTPREGTVEWDRDTNLISFGAKYDRQLYEIRADVAVDVLANFLDTIKSRENRKPRRLKVNRGIIFRP